MEEETEKKRYVQITIEGVKIVDTCEAFNDWLRSGDFAECYFDVAQASVGDGFSVKIIEMTEAEFAALEEFEGF